jgi:hypothetical protein
MNVGESVRHAIDDWQAGKLEAAMMHACNAVDGTAKKLYPHAGVGARFTRLLRENYDEILGPMGAPGIDLHGTRFAVKVKAPGGKIDIAEVIYGIHRCTHGHGDELPDGFDLLPDASDQPRRTGMLVSVDGGAVRLSDRIIFGLLAVAILCPANADQRVPDGYRLFYSNTEVLPINDWWGRAADFPQILATDPQPPPVAYGFDELERSATMPVGVPPAGKATIVALSDDTGGKAGAQQPGGTS